MVAHFLWRQARPELPARASLEAMGLGKSTAQQARNVLEAEGHLRRNSELPE